VTRPTHHWIRVEDVDLAYILNGPDMNHEDGVHDWVEEVLDIVEDGLETA